MILEKTIIIHGWNILAHPLFLGQLKSLKAEVLALSQQHPTTYKKKNSTKRLAAIEKLAFDIIPQDPTRIEYRQGKTLGDGYKHWFRAKFFQQYRLFFRYHEKSKIIIYAWVNDETSKRAYNSKTDAYECFRRMLSSGQPPDSWEQLLSEAVEYT